MTTQIPGLLFVEPFGPTNVHYFRDENEAHTRADWMRRHGTRAWSSSGRHSYDEVQAKLRTYRAEMVAALAAEVAS